MPVLRNLLVVLLLTGCQTDTDVITLSGTAMTMEWRVIVPFARDQGKIKEVILETFNEIDRTFNKWNPDSEISVFNRRKADQPIDLSDALFHLFQKIDGLVVLTEGRFDPTIEPLLALYKKGMTPDEETAQAVGWHQVGFDDSRQAWKKNDTVQIDLGGIAKGLAVDQLIDKLKALGYSDLFVEWGGEIRALGKHPTGRPWKVFVSSFGDTNPEKALMTLSFHDNAVATSGDYYQNYDLPGSSDRISHIVDPRTRKPLVINDNSIASVTVVAPTCVDADALATAAMVFSSLDEAKEWTQSVSLRHPDIVFYLFTRNLK